MNIGIKDANPQFYFIYISIAKSAIYLKELGFDKEFLLNLCDEMWDSMESIGVDSLKEKITACMKQDIDVYIEKYMKNKCEPDKDMGKNG